MRTTTDYGLRFTVQDITQLTPLASAKLTFWGFPAAADHDPQRFPKGRRGTRPAVRERKAPAALREPTRGEHLARSR